MYKDKEETLTDIVLGEAVMALLNNDDLISSTSILKVLQSMASVEREPSRQRACRQAMEELRNYSANESDNVNYDRPGRDDMSHLFTQEAPPDGTNKH